MSAEKAMLMRRIEIEKEKKLLRERIREIKRLEELKKMEELKILSESEKSKSRKAKMKKYLLPVALAIGAVGSYAAYKYLPREQKDKLVDFFRRRILRQKTYEMERIPTGQLPLPSPTPYTELAREGKREFKAPIVPERKWEFKGELKDLPQSFVFRTPSPIPYRVIRQEPQEKSARAKEMDRLIVKIQQTKQIIHALLEQQEDFDERVERKEKIKRKEVRENKEIGELLKQYQGKYKKYITKFAALRKQAQPLSDPNIPLALLTPLDIEED